MEEGLLTSSRRENRCSKDKHEQAEGEEGLHTKLEGKIEMMLDFFSGGFMLENDKKKGL